MGYKEDIQINIDQLDSEWIKQASLYQKYAKEEAMALYARDQLADTLALTQAQLDGDIRLHPDKHGFATKPTEAAILNSIKQNPYYIKANKILMKATCKAKVIGSAVRAFDHKKKALEKLTDLYLSGYWAAPKIRSEAQEVFGKQTRADLEKSLQGEDRLIAASLKKEAEAKTKPTEGGTADQKAVKRETTTKAGVDGVIKAERKRWAAIEKKKKTAAVRTASKKAVAAREKKKVAGKTKSEPKPTGKTKEELLKQNKATPSSKTSKKKK